ncbi:hypothetical protein Q4488_11510 [Amphritea sp. 1_MG-2023]|uniref:transglycosylase SLT domain-containing protein n=1 Tax=Amphritea sp. 1_MG-2023 TaxID=3062670 RepID=UPI0026E38D58|nr:hypothetical protein [Amphritea sp. 1_MG-2023]MDO6564009.1 hypothetical protein [Amphritea sp. 1_MG-2023]
MRRSKIYRSIPVCLLGALLTQGCSQMAEVVPERFVKPDNLFCRGLYQNNDWLDAAAATEQRWGLPLHIALAELNMTVGTEASEYIRPTHADWEEYRLASENWSAAVDDISTALDYLGWHAQMASRRIDLTMNEAGKLYMASRIGHGGLYRMEYRADSLLQRQAEQVDHRAQQYREDLKSCPRIRERADSFFRWPW